MSGEPKNPSLIKEIISKTLQTLIAALLVFVASPFLRWIWDDAAKAVIPQMPQPVILSLLVIPSLLCCALAAWVWNLKSKTRLLKRFAPDKEWVGAYRNKAGDPFCGICLNKDGSVVPLIWAGEDLGCVTCKALIHKYDPNRKFGALVG